MSSVGKRILLVDDDEQLLSLLCMRLAHIGYSAEGVSDADKGLRQACKNEYDLIVLDLAMPKRSGLEICEDLRARGILTPILVLSGNTDKDMIVKGLNIGADDYLTKPFSGNELVARIQSLLRRNRRAFNTQVLQRYDIVLDIASRFLELDNQTVQLTKKETLLLQRLMAEAPKPVSRLALLQDVWGIGNSNASNRLDVYIRRLRTKLADAESGCNIRTIRGGGYYFDRV